MSEFVTLTLIIALFSLVQSVFGVGLLLFGTPTLLILGYSYSETLWIVLPASLSISLAQIYGQHQLVESKRNVFALTLPSAAAGTLIIFQLEGLTDVSKIVGAFLLIMGLLRSSSVLKNNLDLLITKHPKAIFLSTGLIHGLSNMGGGLLSFLMASIHKNKLNIRTNIAFVYCCFCFLQLILLSLFKAEQFNLYCLVFPAFSLLIFLLLNRFLMDLINENEFQHAISLIIIIYGAASLIG